MMKPKEHTKWKITMKLGITHAIILMSNVRKQGIRPKKTSPEMYL